VNRRTTELVRNPALLILLGALCSPVWAGTLFIAADVEDFEFGDGVTTCPEGPCDKIGRADVSGAVHNFTDILPTEFLVNGMADAGGVLLTGTPQANALNTVDFDGNLVSTIAAPGIPNGPCCNEELLFVPQEVGPDKVYHAHFSDVIREIDPSTGEELDVFEQTDVVGMALVNGQIWISKWGPRQIGIWDPGDNSFTVQIDNAALNDLGNTGALAFDPFEQVLWVGSVGGQVTPFDLDGNQLGEGFLPFGPFDETIDGLTFLGEVTGPGGEDAVAVPAIGVWGLLLILATLAVSGLITLRRFS
jgi:hypothetical protein